MTALVQEAPTPRYLRAPSLAMAELGGYCPPT
jgi:hypothetical protein